MTKHEGRSKPIFISEKNVDVALNNGTINSHDILFLDERKIGWINKVGEKVILDLPIVSFKEINKYDSSITSNYSSQLNANTLYLTSLADIKGLCFINDLFDNYSEELYVYFNNKLITNFTYKLNSLLSIVNNRDNRTLILSTNEFNIIIEYDENGDLIESHMHQLATQKYVDDIVRRVVDTITVDKTLTQAGKAADAKVTGDEINSLRNTMGSLYSLSEQATYIEIENTVIISNESNLVIIDDNKGNVIITSANVEVINDENSNVNITLPDLSAIDNQGNIIISSSMFPISDDGEGNVNISLLATDDGEGNVIITSIEITDVADKNGNITIIKQ